MFLLVSQKYESHQPEELMLDASSDCEVVWSKVKVLGSSDFYIGLFYRPPDIKHPEYLQSYSPYWFPSQQTKGHTCGLEVISICLTATGIQYVSSGSAANQLPSLVRDSFLKQVVTEPTRVTEHSSSTLVLFFTCNQSLINKVEVIPGS